MPQSAMLNNNGAEVDEVSGRQYLTFLLAQEQYALDILQVQEIRGWEQVTRIPNSPAYVRGVINLRGTIVPVIDLRLRFGLDAQEYGKETVVIVVRTLIGDDSERSLGLVVDAVSDVMMARDEDVVGTPEFGVDVRTENITGLVSLNGQMVMILDIPGLFEVGGEAPG
jgi:purine-binding chemotaxis protein CheW